MRQPICQLPRNRCWLAACAALGAWLAAAAQQPATPGPPASSPPATQQQPASPQPSTGQPVGDQQPPAASPQTQPPSQSAPSQSAPQPAATQPQPAQASQAKAASTNTTSGESSDAPSITEDELRQQLQGKTFFLRGGYLDNTLHFDDHGTLDGASPQASYTLSLVEITRLHLDKRRLELEGVRYGLHFLGALASEEQSQPYDRVRLTSKKKPLRITIDREDVVKPKKEKEPRKKPAPGKAVAPAAGGASAQSATAVQPQPVAQMPETGRHGVTVTTSQAHANRSLRLALDHIFSPGIDDRMISTLPDYWKLYYKSVASKQEFRPDDPGVLRESQADRKARLISVFEPPSNEYAQTNGVAGMALYRVVVNADGSAGEVAVARPIGFGLDENAVAEIRKARFEPAVKEGKPVPVLLDLVVQFRIYSKRTAAVATASPKPAGPEAPILPGPYSVNLPQEQQPQQQQQQPAPQPQQQP